MIDSNPDPQEMPKAVSSTPIEDSSALHTSGETADSTSEKPRPEDVTQWRKNMRHEIIKHRLSLSTNDRLLMTGKIILGLDTVLGNFKNKIISVYWPFQGEPNLLYWMESIIRRGAQIALPIVIEKHNPLIFKTWAPGEKLEGGIWNIPVPVDGKRVTPDIVIAPLVAFDPHLYRLGYGGGFFDRTLASFPVKPLAIGVGYEITKIPTIFPQSYDVPMDLIVTEHQVRRR
ncbi:MAG: 5-formyltetrahydrofolate cyclo-ligase [Nitrospirales bacterium]